MKPYKKVKFKNRNDWLKGRKKFLGGSDAGIIYGVSKWSNVLNLYCDKLSQFSDNKQNESTVFGAESEPLIRKTFALNFPNYIVKKPKGFESYISRKYPFIGASVDGLLIDKETQEKGILEIKTCDIRKKKDLEEWQNAIPMQYYCQILHYLSVMTDCSFVKVVAQLRMFDFSSELDNKVIELRTIIRHVERKDVEKDIEKLIALEKDFWLNNIEQRIPPSFKRSLN